MSDEYPLYPSLTEQGKEEAQKIMDSFKLKIKAMINELLEELYCDVVYYVESDSWTNYRNKLMDGLKNYGLGKPNHSYVYKELRQAIYENYKDEIIKDLNQDLVKENEHLKDRIIYLQRVTAYENPK